MLNGQQQKLVTFQAFDRNGDRPAYQAKGTLHTAPSSPILRAEI
jgi:hypothetical protein